MKRYNVFGVNKEFGNPAGVSLNKGFTKEEMQSVAKELGYSETAFVESIGGNIFKVRFFTPSNEIEVCGHATIAVFTFLLDENIISYGEYIMECLAGKLEIYVSIDDEIFMKQNKPEFYDVIDKGRILESLGIKEEVLDENIPITIVTTGIRDIFIGVKSREILENLQPDFSKIKNVSEENNVVGYHVYTIGDKNFTAECRNFAPLYDINEECATGTSSGALACLLYKYNKIEDPSNVKFLQGRIMENPCVIKCKLVVQDEEIQSIIVGGKGSVHGTFEENKERVKRNMLNNS